MKQISKFLFVLITVLLFSYGSSNAQYCLPTYSTGCTYGDGLTLFQLGTINQSITCTASYHDYTASSTNMTIGNAYTITVQAGYASTYVNFYVDYNHNSTFDASEMIGQVICGATGTNYTLPFTVPVTALTGNTRLRAMTEWLGYPTGPCSTTESYGNCQDFTVNIVSAGPCTPTYTTGCTFGDGLTLFQLNTINQVVACNGVPNAWYHDWTATSTQIMLNTNYTLTVQAGYASTYVSVWIDYNDDLTFATTERVVTDLICAASGTNYTATINVPLGTLLGNHRMRFRTSWGSTSADPCATYSYGNAGDFTVTLIAYAPPSAPTVTTTAATAIASTGATLNGTVNPNNSTTTVTFDYGLTVAYGTTVSGVPGSLSGNTVQTSSIAITGLAPNTLYHYRIKGSNAVGNTNGGDMTFTTLAIAPTVATVAATGVSSTTATVNGTINANNSSTTVFFDYGLTVAYGTTVGGTPSPVTGNLVTPVSANLTGLANNTTYHYRVRGTNASGTSNGTDMTFFTTCLAAGAAGAITGPAQVCQGGTGYVYTVTPITNASGYVWTPPFGGAIVAGNNTNTITVNYAQVSYSGNLFVYATGCAGNGSPSNMQVTVNTAPIPIIAGPSTVCVNSTGNIYSTQAGMTNYAWAITGGIITAGGLPTSNTSTVTWTAAGSGTISVNYNNTAGCAGFTPTVNNVTVNPLPVPIISGAANPCSAFTSTYTTQGGMTGYNWSASAGGNIVSGSGTNTITVMWNTAGAQQVTVSYTNSSGCTSLASAYAVTVKQGPSPIITGTSLLCVNSGYYTYTTQAGMTAYTWTISAGGTIVSGQGTNALMVTWNATGSQMITVNYTNGNGCTAPSDATFPVTATALPDPAGAITGTSVICAGATNVSYSVAPILNAHTYVWTLPTGASIVSGNGTNSIMVNFANNSQSGNVVVYGNNLCGNGNASPPFAVTVNAMAGNAGTITGIPAVCQGTTGVGYSVNPIPDATGYIWALPAGASISAGFNTNSITVDFSSVAVSGNVSVFGTNSCGNGQVSPNYAVAVNPVPATPVISVVTLDNSLASDATIGNQWYLDGNPIPGATSQTYMPAASGHYTDILTLNGCSSAPSNDIYYLMIGINDSGQNVNIVVYPNPGDGLFRLSITSKVHQSFDVTVINNLGISVYQQKGVDFQGTETQTLDLRSYPDGVYTLVLKNLNNHILRKIVINR
ncbi:MAG: GEVED domain-containing protein [Bacteroidetes bacterium]|nr:GEVED domain-containing protein [Bacteroidota bacterium]